MPTDADGRPLPFLHALMHARLNAHDDFGARLFGDEHGMPHHHSPFAERMPPEAMVEVDAEEEMLRAAIAASLHDHESGCAPPEPEPDALAPDAPAAEPASAPTSAPAPAKASSE